jgi:hypothetical protein
MSFPLAQDGDSTVLDQIPQEVLDELDPSIVQDLAEGVIDKIPQEVIDQLPEGVVDQIPDGLLEAVGADPVLAGILIAIGGLALLGFVYGMVKAAWKAAFFAGLLGAGAWFWYFNIR